VKPLATAYFGTYFVVALTLVTVGGAHKPIPTCGHGDHQRQVMKMRRVPAVMVAAPPIATVHDVVGWQVPVIAAKRADVPVDPRERQVYEVTAYVRLLKLSDDDCDMHLQLSDSPDSGPQIVVEIPINQPAARDAIEKLVGHATTTPKVYEGDESPRITVLGFAFLDLAHAGSIDHWTKEGHGHGTAAVKTLWELHPVFRVEAAQ
jgi:hypothetical protein